MRALLWFLVAFLIVLFPWLALAAPFRASDVLRIPFGEEPVIDGILDPAEWKDAATITLDIPGGSLDIHLFHDGDCCLYMAVEHLPTSWDSGEMRLHMLYNPRQTEQPRLVVEEGQVVYGYSPLPLASRDEETDEYDAWGTLTLLNEPGYAQGSGEFREYPFDVLSDPVPLVDGSKYTGDTIPGIKAIAVSRDLATGKKSAELGYFLSWLWIRERFEPPFDIAFVADFDGLEETDENGRFGPRRFSWPPHTTARKQNSWGVAQLISDTRYRRIQLDMPGDYWGGEVDPTGGGGRLALCYTDPVSRLFPVEVWAEPVKYGMRDVDETGSKDVGLRARSGDLVYGTDIGGEDDPRLWKELILLRGKGLFSPGPVASAAMSFDAAQYPEFSPFRHNASEDKAFFLPINGTDDYEEYANSLMTWRPKVSLDLRGKTYGLEIACTGTSNDNAWCYLTLTDGEHVQTLETYKGYFVTSKDIYWGDESPLHLMWAGDLDRDGKLDLILDVSRKYSFSIWQLYLSSLAKKSDFVYPAACGFHTWD